MSAQTPDSRISRVTGNALVLRGDDIDTDRIMPARFLRSVSFDGLERHLFEDDRAAAGRGGGQPHPLDSTAGAGATILLVNRNFGCGSSREHAPQAIVRYGFKAVVGESFAEIFFSNAVALGLPCVVAAKDDVQALMAAVESGAGQPVEIDLTTLEVRAGAVRAAVTLPAPAREAFLAGTWDATALLTADFDVVRQVEARLGYEFGSR
jgi:3-isopropylmalate/(R)-2-methylmalate dehydratase small subunit